MQLNVEALLIVMLELDCLAHDLWSELNSQVDNFLIHKSLEDVIANKRPSIDRKLKDLIVTG